MSNLVPQDLAIEVADLKKSYRIFKDPLVAPILSAISPVLRRRLSRDAVALSGINLSVPRGQVVGVVGPNGSGKTTLLKCIAGMLPFESGSISVRGRLTVLLALGVGVHSEMSGRENIYYSGLLLGLSEREIADRTQSIIEFADIGTYIDMPLRTYSSGMRARLLFSIAMCVDPDVLIVDEALATGDASFVAKAQRRVRALCESGATVLFVSHNNSQIVELCDRAIFLMNGSIRADGNPADVLREYTSHVARSLASTLRQNPPIGAPPMIGGDATVVIEKAELSGGDPVEPNLFVTGDDFQLNIDYLVADGIDKVETHVFVGFLTEEEQDYVGSYNSLNGLTSTGATDTKRLMLAKRGRISVNLSPLVLTTGAFSLWIILYLPGRVYCEYKAILPFFVRRPEDLADRAGYFRQPGEISAS